MPSNRIWIPDPPRRVLGSASVKVAANWVVTGSARWDLEANKVNQYIVGAGYVDDCFVLAANYATSLQLRRGHHAARAQPRLHAADRPADPCQHGDSSWRRDCPVEPAPTCTAERIHRASWLPIRIVDTANMIMATTFFQRLSLLILGFAAGLYCWLRFAAACANRRRHGQRRTPSPITTSNSAAS